jgi:acetyl esterase/lipase
MSEQVSIESNVVFARAGERELQCEIFRPPSSVANRGGVLLVHGGAWQMGDRSQLRGYGIQLGREGFMCVATSYRLIQESPWPAQIHDVNAGLRFMALNADVLGIDADRIALLGASAGGHLALLAASARSVEAFAGRDSVVVERLGSARSTFEQPTESRVRALVAIFPPTLLSPRDTTLRGAVPGFALLGDYDTEEASRLASPLSHVRADHPPTLLLHGNADELVPPAASILMYEALVDAGVPVELHMVAEQPHAYVLQRDFHRLSVQTIALFLRRYMGLRQAIQLPSSATGAAPRA